MDWVSNDDSGAEFTCCSGMKLNGKVEKLVFTCV